MDPIKLENGLEYKVDAILHYKWVGQWHTHLEYSVFFDGYDTSHNKWLPTANLANALDILRLNQNSHPLF